MTRIDDTRVPGATEIYRKYQNLLRQSAQNEEGRMPTGVISRKQTAARNSEEMKMAQASRDFEALFIQQMLSEMRRGLLHEDSVFGEDGGSLAADRNRNSFFRDQMYENISQDIANQGGFGIGSVLFEQLYRQQHPDVLPNATTTAVVPKVDSVQQLLQRQQVPQQVLSQAQLSRFYQ